MSRAGLLPIALLLVLLPAGEQGCSPAGGAPAPAPKRERPRGADWMAGEWIMDFNGGEWAVTLTQEGERGGLYRATNPQSGTVWSGYWNVTSWPDVFVVHERPESSQGPYSAFPLRYDGREILVTGRVGLEDEWRGPDWGHWGYANSRVSIRRAGLR